MTRNYSDIVFDASEGSYYNIKTDIFLSEDDASYLELPDENKVAEAVRKGTKFNRSNDDDIVIDDFFLSQFEPVVDKTKQVMEHSQGTIDEIINKYEKDIDTKTNE